jgi:hypothetical protein
MSKPEDAGREPSWVPARAVVRAPRRETDWNTTIIAAGSFLLHFGALSSIYSDWTDPIVDEGLTIARLVETARDLPTAPEIETSKEETPETAAPRPADKPGATSTLPKKTGESGSSGISGKRPTQDSAAAIADQMARLDAEMLATLNSTGPATDRVLRDGVLPLEDLVDVENRAASYRPGISFGPSTTRIPGESTSTLSDLGRTGNGDPPVGSGSARAVRPPPSSGRIGVGDPAVGDVPGAAGVIAGLQGAFRRCYTKGLELDPGMRGGVRVTARIGPNGEVVSAGTSVSGTVSGAVAACMAGKISGAQFSPPTGGGTATLVVPITVVPQQ